MKINNILYIVIIAVLSLVSCSEDKLEGWSPKSKDYSGKFVYTQLDKVQNPKHGTLFISNTASNKKDEILIDVENVLKSKFNILGEMSDFKSVSDDFSKLTENMLNLDVKPKNAPTGANQTVSVDIDNCKVSLIEAKILKGKGTSVGGNKSDSIYLQFKLYKGKFNFESYLKPKNKNTDPDEFDWKFVSSQDIQGAKLDTLTLGGYRYTGFPEDNE